MLQLATESALKTLGSFLSNPTLSNATELVSILVLYNILKLQWNPDMKVYSPSVISLACWIHRRGTEVLHKLKVHGPLENRLDGQDEENWRAVRNKILNLEINPLMMAKLQTGTCYSMPQIRHRPTYPRLSHDQRQESGGSRGAKCSKYWSKYGERKLTGGIMGAWCTHSICYGFHCIPKGEGRNDVFSALVTRWPSPPKRVIYDFACALGPYCMLREPDFFADTLFVIDNFHAPDHKKCSPAAFLSNYAAVDPRLGKINSSAAECGNSGITQIRKSVSYMSQTRAIQYTKVFISIWNRERIRRLQNN